MTQEKDPTGIAELEHDERMPASVEAERVILANMLMENSLIPQASRLLRHTDFYFHGHQELFRAMTELSAMSVPVDPIMLADHLKKQDRMHLVGGVGDIAALTVGMPFTTNLAHWANVVRRHSRSRNLMRDAYDAYCRAKDGADPADVSKWLVDRINDEQEQTGTLRRPKSLSEMYDDYKLRLMLFHKGVTNAIPTGFREIDEKLLGGGVIPGFTYVIGGRPSMGKSTFVLDVLCNIADLGHRCMYVTREMPKESLMDRMVAGKSNVSRFKIQSGISSADYEAALEAVEILRLVPIIIDDTSETVEEVDAFLGDMERLDQRIDFLAVDYLQLMSGSKRDGRTVEVSAVSRAFKGLAMRREVPVMEVSQLTRAPGRENREPELYDLRESGQIEQDADFVGFLHGDEPEEGMTFYERQFLCRKQREGPHFHRLLDMNAELVTFRTPEMLGHTGKQRSRPGRITQPQMTRPTDKPIGFRKKKVVADEQRALDSISREKREDFDF